MLFGRFLNNRTRLRFDKSQTAGGFAVLAHNSYAVGVADVLLVENAVCRAGDGGIDGIVGFFEIVCGFHIFFTGDGRIGEAVGVLIHVDTLGATTIALVVFARGQAAF